MRRLIRVFLLTLVFTAIASTTVFAANESEPNNSYQQANFISQGQAYNGYLTPGDLDCFRFSTARNANQPLYFLPPDNQSYVIGVYDMAQIDTSNGQYVSPIVYRIASYSAGRLVDVSFTAQAWKSYYIYVFGSVNTTIPYVLILSNQQ